MKRALLVLVAALTAAGAGGWWWLHRAAGPEVWQGYVDAEYVRVSPTLTGRITDLAVARGAQVAAGAPLFTQDGADDVAARSAAAGKLAEAEARLTNLETRSRDTEIAQVIKEYLSSLVENSPLKDVFAAWAGRIAGRDEPPGAAEAVVPDPARLKDAALAATGREVARTPVTDPAAVSRLAAETGVAAAVDLANQVRYLQEGNGPCEGCTRPEPPSERRGPDDHPFKPPEFVR